MSDIDYLRELVQIQAFIWLKALEDILNDKNTVGIRNRHESIYNEQMLFITKYQVPIGKFLIPYNDIWTAIFVESMSMREIINKKLQQLEKMGNESVPGIDRLKMDWSLDNIQRQRNRIESKVRTANQQYSQADLTFAYEESTDYQNASYPGVSTNQDNSSYYNDVFGNGTSAVSTSTSTTSISTKTKEESWFSSKKDEPEKSGPTIAIIIIVILIALLLFGGLTYIFVK